MEVKENKEVIRVFYKKNQIPGKAPFIWTWEEAKKYRLYGHAESIEEIEKACSELFPGKEVRLLDVAF